MGVAYGICQFMSELFQTIFLSLEPGFPKSNESYLMGNGDDSYVMCFLKFHFH